ncbi:hypothetical protein FIBSPDRAFT_495456 [Athelia psychrophila]|uniref:F-box domain-containing protein n=1 Tax=Athelia psychrophila TaxID=1759441 RepID=A0A166KJ47_9AGAM|nr:hypothetical protein FIBSPDRAFT_495456 [Fibularhizoctonia sp. CBS 109695]
MEETRSPLCRIPPQIPPELLINIIYLAASSSRHSALDLCLVSSWARDIAIRCLLDTVVIRNHLEHQLFWKFLIKSPTQTSTSNIPFAHSVRNLWVTAVSPHVVRTYAACESVQHLALSDGSLSWLLNASVMGRDPLALHGHLDLSEQERTRRDDMHLTLFIIGFLWRNRQTIIWDSTKTFPLLRNITRLRFANYGFRDGITVHDIDPFPNLTHLAIASYGSVSFEDFASQILAVKSIQMFVLVMTTSRIDQEDVPRLMAYARQIRKSDSRLYLAQSIWRGMDIQPEWEDDMRRGRNIWDRAVEYTELHVDVYNQ